MLFPEITKTTFKIYATVRARRTFGDHLHEQEYKTIKNWRKLWRWEETSLSASCSRSIRLTHAKVASHDQERQNHKKGHYANKCEIIFIFLENATIFLFKLWISVQVDSSWKIRSISVNIWPLRTIFGKFRCWSAS